MLASKGRPPGAIRDGDTVRVGATVYRMEPSEMKPTEIGVRFGVFRNDNPIGTVTYDRGVRAAPRGNNASVEELIRVTSMLYDDRGNPT